MFLAAHSTWDITGFDSLVELEYRVERYIDYCFSYGARVQPKAELESGISCIVQAK
jgi:hypothetical protein